MGLKRVHTRLLGARAAIHGELPGRHSLWISSSLYVDSKTGLAEAVGKHRGDVPHAQDLARDVRSPKEAEREASTDAPMLDKGKSPELAIQIELGGGRQRSFEIGL